MGRSWFMGLLAVGILSSAGCEREGKETIDTETAVPKSADTTPQSVAEPIADPARRKPQWIESQVPLLAHGEHMVYGIRMPKGMMPMKAGEKVNRFEGTHSLAAVKKYIESQLAGTVEVRPNRFGDGFFISNAIAKSSQRDLDNLDLSAKRYNIKIFEGSLGGAALDIWEATPGMPAEEVADMGRGSAYRNLVGYPERKSRKPVAVPKVNLETRTQRERATFSVFDKLSKGAPLTEADYQSPFFTDL